MATKPAGTHPGKKGSSPMQVKRVVSIAKHTGQNVHFVHPTLQRQGDPLVGLRLI